MSYYDNEISTRSLVTSFYENESFLFIKTDVHGHITSLSKASLSVLASRPSELIGKHIKEIFHIEQKSPYSLDYYIIGEKLYEGNIATYSRQGKKLFFSVTLDKNPNDLEDGFILCGYNTTRLYRENLTLKEQVSFLDEQSKTSIMQSLVAKKTSAAVVITDRFGLIEWVNDGFTNATGYTLQEIRGKKPGSFLQGPKTDPLTVDRISKNLRQEKKVDEIILNYKKSGEEFYFHLLINPIKNSFGETSHYIAIHLVIDANNSQKNLEEETPIIDHFVKENKENLLFRKTFENKSNTFFFKYCLKDHFVKLNRESTDGGDICMTNMINNSLVIILISSQGTDVEKTLLNSIILKEYNKYIDTYHLEPNLLLNKIDFALKNLQMDHKIITSTSIMTAYYNLKTKEFGFSSAGIPYIHYTKVGEVMPLEVITPPVSSKKSNKYFLQVFNDVEDEQFYFYTNDLMNKNVIDRVQEGNQEVFSHFLMNLVQMPFASQEKELTKIRKHANTDFSIIGLKF